MAREHANIRLDMWGDDDWRQLTVNAQHLYLHLLTSPTLSYAGVADWRPARIAGVSTGATSKSIITAADELGNKLFTVRDDETEEILIRSFLKHDGLLKKPNVAKAMVAAFAKTVSPTLRGVIVHELVKLHKRHPEWSAFALGEVQELLTRPTVNPSAKGSAKGSNPDASLLTTNYSLLTTNSTQLTTQTNEVRSDIKQLCEYLAEWVEKNGSKRPTITTTWHTEARLLIDKDKRDFETAMRLICWCQEDTFWKGNILSIPTFRKKYDQLRLAANREIEERKNANPTRTQQNLSVVAQYAALENQQKGINQ